MIGATKPAPVSTAPGKEPLFPEPLISRQYLEDWNQAVRVRQISEKYEATLEQASDEGIPVEEYMKKNGMQDWTQFRLSCDKFSFFCGPMELAELGSGVVLYFHFLVFLAGFLFIAFLIQLPAVAEYWGKDNLDKWNIPVMSDDPDSVVMDDMFFFTSPGHLGPHASDNETVPLCYFALVCALCGAIIINSGWQAWVDHTCDEEVTHPNDFAIMVEGLPASATNEEDILNFFKQHAIRGQETEVVKVVIGWTADEYRRSLREMKELRKALSELDPVTDLEQVKEKTLAIAKISKDLQSITDGNTKLHSSGVVVVSFRYQGDMRRCVDRWSGVYATLFYRDWGGCCGLCPGPPLPKLPTASGVGVWKLNVRRAPNPGDINWDDLGVSRSERYWKLAETNGCMLLIIGVSFGITFGMATIKESTDNMWLGLLPAIGLCIANILMVVAAGYFGEKEFHQTRTGQTASQALKMTVGMIINTGGVILLINRQEWQWYKKAGLVSDIFFLMGLTAVIQPLMQLTDMKYYLGKRQRMKLTDERIKNLSENAANYNANGVGADKDAFMNFKKQYLTELAFFKQKWEPSEIDMKKRYAYAVRNFVCCMLFCHIAPFISLVGIIGLAVQYWVDKRMLTNWYKYPTIQWGRSQADMSLTFLRFTTLLMPVSMWFFLEPSFTSSDPLVKYMILSYAPAVGICILPLSGIRWILCAPCRGRTSHSRVAAADTQEDYYHAQYLWPKDQKYHKSHGLYKFLNEKQNPEFLEPGVSSTTKADDIKGSYGASTAAVIATSTAPPGTTATVPGATSVTPAVVGSTTTPTLIGDDGPKVMGATGGKDHGKTSKSGGPVWEKEAKYWHAFDDCCQDHIEKQYQKWVGKGKKSGGDARINVKIDDAGTRVSIDFDQMTSMLVKKKGKHGHVQKIRRKG